MNLFSKQKPWLLIGFCLFLAGCPALPILIPPLVQFGASLLDSAVNNYDATHQQNMKTLLTALQQRTNPYLAQGNTAHQNNQAGGYQQPGDPSQQYQTEPGYPPSQEYPQQSYDPYQNTEPQYGEYTQEPSNPNHFPQGNPYDNNQSAPYPQTSPSGYPSEPQNQYPQQGQPYPDTYGNEGMPSDPYSQNPYGNAPVPQGERIGMGQPMAVPISLDALLVKKHLVNGVQSYLPIKDGDALFDGRGNPQAGDKFRVMFRANTNCYVYVIAVDGTAWAQGIFPSTSSPFANPVKAGQQHLLPEGNNWFSLDQFKGIETIFFVASHERRPDIEGILTTISGRERHPSEKPLAVSEPAIIPNGFSGTRPSASPFAFSTSQRTQQALLPTTYFVKTAGEDLRITRWFRHQ
jgi:hypothetical protein